MEEKKEVFRYAYSAREQEELRKIRQKYLPREENKLEQLRRLDQSTTRKGTVTALAVGVAGSLLFGIGMCCTMVWADTLFVPGIITGIIGLAGISAAYPLYLHVTKKERERLAPEIMHLTEEMMK